MQAKNAGSRRHGRDHHRYRACTAQAADLALAVNAPKHSQASVLCWMRRDGFLRMFSRRVESVLFLRLGLDVRCEVRRMGPADPLSHGFEVLAPVGLRVPAFIDKFQSHPTIGNIMKIKFACALLGCLMSASVLAGGAEGRVIGLMPYSTNDGRELFFFKVETVTSLLGCNTTRRFSIPSDNPRYKGTFATILAAYHSGMSVKVYGSGTCNNWVDTEDLWFVCFGDAEC